MIDINVWKKAWALLDARERRHGWITLSIVIVAAMSSALMVGSVLPFLSVLSNPDQIRQVPVLAWFYETLGFSDDFAFIVALGSGSFAIVVVSNLIQITKTYAVSRFALMRIHSISHRLLIAYLRQPYSFFLNRHTGEMSTRVLSEADLLVNKFLRPALELIAASFTIVAIVGLLLWIDLLVTAIAFGVLGGIYALVYTNSRRILLRHGKLRADSNSERFRVANEGLSGIKEIKVLGLERSYSARYAEPSHRMARALVAVQVMSEVPNFFLQIVSYGGIILICLTMIDAERLASGGALGEILPLLGVFAFAGQRLLPELSKCYRSLAQLTAGGAAVSAVHEDLLDKAGWGNWLRDVAPAIGLTNQLVLINVQYRYPNAEVASLKDVSITINAGERVGVVGSTGAGKTTLADVILGLLSPIQGRILADGIEITSKNLRSWQQSVGYIPQEIFLIDATLTENIALGVPPEDIDDDRVRRAAEIACIDVFIQEELPEGYNTIIGERGVRLSGGQRQRIGIARTLYNDADLIVFDEATSALDNLTEREVMTSIEALPGEKTVLMIAHRLSTVKRCDRIIILDRGQLVGCDTWDGLMADNAFFRKVAGAVEQTADEHAELGGNQ